jgi:hypothetical protein
MRVVVWLTVASLLPGFCLADCGTNAAAAAQRFWEAHSRFFERDDPSLSDAITRRFYAALKRGWACVAKNPTCLEYAPWPNPADVRTTVRPAFYVSVKHPDHVLVSMKYALPTSDGRPGSEEVVILTLTQLPNRKCWLVDDVVTPEHGSIRGRFHRPDS